MVKAGKNKKRVTPILCLDCLAVIVEITIFLQRLKAALFCVCGLDGQMMKKTWQCYEFGDDANHPEDSAVGRNPLSHLHMASFCCI